MWYLRTLNWRRCSGIWFEQTSALEYFNIFTCTNNTSSHKNATSFSTDMWLSVSLNMQAIDRNSIKKIIKSIPEHRNSIKEKNRNEPELKRVKLTLLSLKISTTDDFLLQDAKASFETCLDRQTFFLYASSIFWMYPWLWMSCWTFFNTMWCKSRWS